jgi:hypothetical protein
LMMSAYKSVVFDREYPDPVRASIAAGQAIARASGTPTAARVAHSLYLCCETLARSQWPEVAWRFSGLTADGSPLEFTFSSVDNHMRFTVDAAPPERENHERIAAACDLAACLGHERLVADDLFRWTQMQQNRKLSWGARLGVRESGGQEKVKYYLEVPLEAQASIRTIINPPLSDSIVVMIGCDPQGGASEYYFRQQKLSKVQLDCLVSGLGDDRVQGGIQDAIEHLCGMPIASALEWTNFGYSLVQQEQSAISQLTCFVRCRAIGGADRVRQRMLEWMPDSVRRHSLYYRLVAHLPKQEVPDHGVISLSCTQSGGPEMRVGLSSAALSRLLLRASMDERGRARVDRTRHQDFKYQTRG